jgi:Tol biopolymer transport system component
VLPTARSGTRDCGELPFNPGPRAAPPRLLRKDVGAVRPLGFDRDGSLYYGLPISTSEVFEAQLDRETAQVVSEPSPVSVTGVGFKTSPAWSPDGRSLAHVAQAPPWRDRDIIVLRSLDSGEQRHMSLALSLMEHLRWTPDGKHLLLTGHDFTDQHGLHRVDVATGRTEAIVLAANGDLIRHPMLAPDGRTLYYRISRLMAEPSVLIARDLPTGREREISPNVYRFALSADGRWLAYTVLSRPVRTKTLFIAQTAGGTPRELLQGRIHDVAWMPDGEHILFAETRDQAGGITTDLWLLPARGGARRPVGISMPSLRDVTIHPGGQRIAFVSGRHAFEVWVMERLARFSVRGGEANAVRRASLRAVP